MEEHHKSMMAAFAGAVIAASLSFVDEWKREKTALEWAQAISLAIVACLTGGLSAIYFGPEIQKALPDLHPGALYYGAGLVGFSVVSFTLKRLPSILEHMLNRRLS